MPRGIPAKKKEEADKDPAELAPHELVFLQSIRDFFHSLHLHSDKMLVAKIGRDKLADYALEFHAFICYGAGELMKNQQLALANHLWNCLARYIQNVGTPVTLNTLLNSIGLLEAAVNESFPGYMQAKLLSYIITPPSISH